MEMGTALLLSGLLSAGATAYTGMKQIDAQEDALEKQKKAQTKAEAEQQAADESAERKRLEGIATNQSVTDYGNIWGAQANAYKDAAQKLSAGTGSFNTDDEETNPFYQRGLL